VSSGLTPLNGMDEKVSVLGTQTADVLLTQSRIEKNREPSRDVRITLY